MSRSAISTCFLNTSRDGDSTTSLDSLFQCPTTLPAKKFFLISNLNPPDAIWGHDEMEPTRHSLKNACSKTSSNFIYQKVRLPMKGISALSRRKCQHLAQASAALPCTHGTLPHWLLTGRKGLGVLSCFRGRSSDPYMPLSKSQAFFWGRLLNKSLYSSCLHWHFRQSSSTTARLFI